MLTPFRSAISCNASRNCWKSMRRWPRNTTFENMMSMWLALRVLSTRWQSLQSFAKVVPSISGLEPQYARNVSSTVSRDAFVPPPGRAATTGACCDKDWGGCGCCGCCCGDGDNGVVGVIGVNGGRGDGEPEEAAWPSDADIGERSRERSSSSKSEVRQCLTTCSRCGPELQESLRPPVESWCLIGEAARGGDASRDTQTDMDARRGTIRAGDGARRASPE
mmetsp:Transcript_44873/g.130720  ORF Transcript_44873/g.130720 Transcript_44873/m.130720 type:complete len:221 (+) Transcript_44873:1898-2560(+)